MFPIRKEPVFNLLASRGRGRKGIDGLQEETQMGWVFFQNVPKWHLTDISELYLSCLEKNEMYCPQLVPPCILTQYSDPLHNLKQVLHSKILLK